MSPRDFASPTVIDAPFTSTAEAKLSLHQLTARTAERRRVESAMALRKARFVRTDLSVSASRAAIFARAVWKRFMVYTPPTVLIRPLSRPV